MIRTATKLLAAAVLPLAFQQAGFAGEVVISLDEGSAAAGAMTAGTANHQCRLSANGAEIEVYLDGVLHRTLGKDTTDRLTIAGSAVDDTLVLDFSHGSPVPPGGIDYDGRGQASSVGDSLELWGGYLPELVYDATGPKTGIVKIPGASEVRFADLEPLTVLAALGTITVNVNDALGHAVEIQNDTTTPGRSEVRIDGGLESVMFNNPLTSLTVNTMDGNDNVTVNAMDPGFAATLTIDAGNGNDTVTLNDTSETMVITGGQPTVAPGDTLSIPSDWAACPSSRRLRDGELLELRVVTRPGALAVGADGGGPGASAPRCPDPRHAAAGSIGPAHSTPARTKGAQKKGRLHFSSARTRRLASRSAVA